MLEPNDLQRVSDLVVRGVLRTELRDVVEGIRTRLNPHPAHQKEVRIGLSLARACVYAYVFKLIYVIHIP